MLIRQCSLCSFGFSPEFLYCFRIALDVLAVLALDQFDEVLHDALVKIFAAQVSISVRLDHFEHAVVNGKNGYVKGPSAKIEDEDIFLALFVQAVSDCRGSRLVDDSRHV